LPTPAKARKPPFGAGGGAAVGVFPRTVRARWWTGPAFGLLVWLGFELGIAPMLCFEQANRVRPVDRLALTTDHPLYDLVLSGPVGQAHD